MPMRAAARFPFPRISMPEPPSDLFRFFPDT
jgi:hypothetical protein